MNFKKNEINLERKVLPVSVKVQKEKGIIEAYVSIFGNKDMCGEIIDKGAFTESLKKKLPKGVWSHNWDMPVAKTLEAREDDKGLYIKGQFNLNTQRGREAFSDIAFDIMDEFSIGYRVQQDEIDDNGIRHLKKIRLYEWSPVLVGANPETELVGIKSSEKPYPNEHSCRLRNPDDFEKDSFRRTTRKHNKKEYSVIMGKLKGEDTMTEQSYRYKTKVWSEDEAKNHCKDHGGTFHPAKGKEAEQVEKELNKDDAKTAMVLLFKDALEQLNKSLKNLDKTMTPLTDLLSAIDKAGGEKVASIPDEKEKIVRIRQSAKKADRVIEKILRITK